MKCQQMLSDVMKCHQRSLNAIKVMFNISQNCITFPNISNNQNPKPELVLLFLCLLSHIFYIAAMLQVQVATGLQ